MSGSIQKWWGKFTATIREWQRHPTWGPGEWVVLILIILVLSLVIVASGSPTGREVLSPLPTRTPLPTFTSTPQLTPTPIITQTLTALA